MKDKYQWLEEVQGTAAIDWVKIKNEESIQKIKNHPWFSEIESNALKIFNSKDKIPFVSLEGEYVYNLWNDEVHIQGIYRRTKVTEYLKADPSWEILIDLDELSKKENVKWVFSNFIMNREETRALVFLSPGGSDANIMREFDVQKKEYIIDGFILPEGKGSAHWVDDDTIRLERTHGLDSVTDSGYARTIRDWKRGKPLDSAKVIYEIEKSDFTAFSKDVRTLSNTYFFVGRYIDFYNVEELIYQNGQWRKLSLPTMFEDHKILGNQYILKLKQNWNQFNIGDILAYNLETHECKKIFSVNKNESIHELSTSKSGFYVIIDEDVKGTLYKFTFESSGEWAKVKIEMPLNGSVEYLSTDYQSDKFFVSFCSFNKPTTYYYGEGEKIICAAKSSPSFFNHEDVIVEQSFSTSLDGTKIPYFMVYKKGLKFDGTNPTILYGYGGFEVSMKPYFSNSVGASWISHGGVYVLSNIRGGGEYGPLWHQAALKENRHKAYEDFFSIAEDLIERKITSTKHLGAAGGSNGGLLMGVCYTQRPDLFSAINCGVPLLDMSNYHNLLAGASWIAEYGNPDDEIDGAYIKSISPYQNIKEIADYPKMFLHTSTKDDRVHPGHARKFAAKLFEYGHSCYYYENILGGHSGAANLKESAFLHAFEMCFFWSHLK
jgi:prolyl oligopeptidase